MEDNEDRVAVTAILAASSLGKPKIPVLMQGNAMVSMPCSAARANVLR